MKVLVVGSGGREHALAWKIAKDARVDEVLAAPGSAGMASVATPTSVAADDVDGLLRLATDAGVDLTVVGPEAPLAAGLVDRFEAAGLRAFGPTAEGAQLEASKAYMKGVLVEAGVPTAAYKTFEDLDRARSFARELGAPLVVKADGLAAGKGVVVCTTLEEADAALASMLEGGRFGEAGRSVVVEEFLAGEEASIMALTDGERVLSLASSQDHKAAEDGDRGPNTGGMGAYSPAPVVSEALHARIVDSILVPTVETLRARGIRYRGVLYAGLMIADGEPKVLEYNVRFGDPECQPIMMRLESSLVDLVEGALDGTLASAEVRWRPEAAAGVVMAAGGYPGTYAKGAAITGIEEASSLDDVTVFHAGTTRDEDGTWRTAGGRVLAVTALGDGIAGAVQRAYAGVERIRWEGVHYRTDIGHRAIARERD